MGVTKKGNVWEAKLKRKGKEYYLGRFPTKDEALAMVEKAAQAHAEGKEIPKKLKPKEHPLKGVYRNRGRWIAMDTKTGKYIGSFSTIERAKQAVEDYKAGRPIQKEEKQEKHSSGSVEYYRYGVYKDNPKWRARYKRRHLGYYDTEEEAWEAIKNAKLGIFPKKKRGGRKPNKNTLSFYAYKRRESGKIQLFMRNSNTTKYLGTFNNLEEVERAKQLIREAISEGKPIPSFKQKEEEIQV